MLIVNKRCSLSLCALVVVSVANAHASSLCAVAVNSAIVATTPKSDFIDNGDGTVTHLKTELTWQRCSLGQRWDGISCQGDAEAYYWVEALQQAEKNQFTGRTGWRLPSKNELASIVEQKCSYPSINGDLFPNTPEVEYWTATPANHSHDYYAEGYAWQVHFFRGYVSYTLKSFSGYVRLVRDALEEPSGEPGIEIINGSPENRKEERTTGQ